MSVVSVASLEGPHSASAPATDAPRGLEATCSPRMPTTLTSRGYTPCAIPHAGVLCLAWGLSLAHGLTHTALSPAILGSVGIVLVAVVQRLLVPRANFPATLRRRLVRHGLVAVLGVLHNVVFFDLAARGVPRALDYLVLAGAMLSAIALTSYRRYPTLAITFAVSVMVPQAVLRLASPAAGGTALAWVSLAFLPLLAHATRQQLRDEVEQLSLARALVNARQQAEESAHTDFLTGIPNRRAMCELGELLMANAQRYRSPMCALMLDIDHFKLVNDEYGHHAGDIALCEVAAILKDTLRSSDVFARMGGEEFAVLLPNTAGREGLLVAERLRKRIGAQFIETPAGDFSVTASIGLTCLDLHHSSLQSLLDQADAALYHAKKTGRNRVIARTGPT